MTRKTDTRVSQRILDGTAANSVRNKSLPRAGFDRQRIDRWLWHARLVRTREAAAQLAGSGFVRINGVRIDTPGRHVRRGDVITVALERTVRVLRVTAFAARRSSAATGRKLYEELT